MTVIVKERKVSDSAEGKDGPGLDLAPLLTLLPPAHCYMRETVNVTPLPQLRRLLRFHRHAELALGFLSLFFFISLPDGQMGALKVGYELFALVQATPAILLSENTATGAI